MSKEIEYVFATMIPTESYTNTDGSKRRIDLDPPLYSIGEEITDGVIKGVVDYISQDEFGWVYFVDPIDGNCIIKEKFAKKNQHYSMSKHTWGVNKQ